MFTRSLLVEMIPLHVPNLCMYILPPWSDQVGHTEGLAATEKGGIQLQLSGTGWRWEYGLYAGARALFACMYVSIVAPSLEFIF
jgi:hypothetical protein